MDYTHFINKTSRRRKPTELRKTGIAYVDALARGERIISLGGGMPNNDTFPIIEGTFTLRDGSEIILNQSDMQTAQQYSSTYGLLVFRKWLTDLLMTLHNPPTFHDQDQNRKLSYIVTNGGQEAICQVFESMICEDDSVLVQAPLSSDVISAMNPLGAKPIPLSCDKHGIIPDLLKATLECLKKSSKVCKLLYCCPSGNDPTGATMPLKRRREIYAIAREHNLMIIEHDPYYLLQLGQYVPSFLSLDEDGRVIRIDSFSSAISSGMRLGILSGPNFITEKIDQHLSCSSIHASSFSQMIVTKLLEKWDIDGFLQHCQNVAGFYKEQRDLCIKTAVKNLDEMCEWEEPDCGMFLWLKIKNVSRGRLKERLAQSDVFTHGRCFWPTSGSDEHVETSAYLRVCFSSVTKDDMDKKFAELAKVLRGCC